MTEKITTTARQAFGIDSAEPVTFNPTPTLAFYDEKAQTKLILNTDDISFLNSEGKLGGQFGNGIMTLTGEKGSFAMLTPYNLNLQDQTGFSAILGITNLATPRTGEINRTSAASLALFDKDKNVIWKAP